MSSSSTPLALALLLLVSLSGMLPLVSPSRGLIGVTTDGTVEDHLLMAERFHGWMAKHGRSYPTADEKLRRFAIYRCNVEFIEAANRDGRLTYTLAENQFTDLTHGEFLATHSSRHVAPPDFVRNGQQMVITTRAGVVEEGRCQAASNEVPSSVNWADQGKVTKVKQQGTKCAACWAFTAVATIESAYAIAKGGEPPVLSEQELIDCDHLDHGCKSGEIYNAYYWVVNNGGIASDSTYPYRAENGTCKDRKLDKNAATISDYRFVEEMCEEQLMVAVAARPVAVLFDDSDECFKFYGYGVYNGMCINRQGDYVGPCSSTRLTHTMTIVGYSGKGDDKEKHWVAKNSWGEKWGDKGYILLKKDVANPEGLCGIAIQPVYPVV